MSQEDISSQLTAYLKDIRENRKTLEEAVRELHQTCFAKPVVPKSEFLALCRKYDPNFAPISSRVQRSARAALTKRVQQESLTQQLRSFDPLDPSFKDPDGKAVTRRHRILFRDLDLPAQQKMFEIVTSGDKKALANIFHERLLSKKDDVLSLLDMNDEQLVDNYFKLKDQIDLVREMESYLGECDFSETQRQDYNTLFAKQNALTQLISRIDLIANPYYADFPCEDISLSNANATMLAFELRGLADKHKEHIGGRNGEFLGGPTYELGREFFSMRSYGLAAIEEVVAGYTAAHNAKKEDCLWATANGKLDSALTVLDTLHNNELVFVNLPGHGIKALYNAGSDYKNCNLQEASMDVVHDHMLRAAEKGMHSVEAANPFYLSAFTGSAQYNQLEEKYKEVIQALRAMKPPVSDDAFERTTQELKILSESAQIYLNYKKDQGRDLEEGVPVGKSAREQRRINTAVDALELCKALSFQSKYQLDAKLASNELQAQFKPKTAKTTGTEKKETKPSASSSASTIYTGEEMCHSSIDELKAAGASYKTIVANQPSSAGKAFENLSETLPSAVNYLATMAAKNRDLSGSYGSQSKENMAKLVLFDYVLRERIANRQTEAPVTAGMLETALNNGFTPSYFSKTPEFNAAIGKFTPARIEQFLTQNESKNKVFDTAVQDALLAVKLNSMDGQSVQQQPQAVISQQPQPQPKTAEKPMVPTG